MELKRPNCERGKTGSKTSLTCLHACDLAAGILIVIIVSSCTHVFQTYRCTLADSQILAKGSIARGGLLGAFWLSCPAIKGCSAYFQTRSPCTCHSVQIAYTSTWDKQLSSTCAVVHQLVLASIIYCKSFKDGHLQRTRIKCCACACIPQLARYHKISPVPELDLASVA